LYNDVHCKHGATVGPVNQDELFYLCSRGLAPEEATKMLVMGFFDPILSKLPLDHQKERILRGIEERLG
jgi:Fe-S cluster assembly protein SufD